MLAVEAVRDHLDIRSQQLFVARDMDPFFQYLLPNQPYVHVLDKRATPIAVDGRRPWILGEADERDHDGFVFHRERDHLWNIARRHYFDVGLMPVRGSAQFLSGWSAPEQHAAMQLRSMSSDAAIRLASASGESVLWIQFRVPGSILVSHGMVTISLNGRVLDRFAAQPDDNDHEYHVAPAPNGATNLLEISVDGALDAHGIGLSLTCLSFGPE